MNKYVLFVVVALLAIAILRRRGQSTPSRDLDATPPTDADIDRLIMEGRKIDAIKAYRRLKGVDLKDAKDAVDARENQIKGRGP
jgi:ribosomal protein L7/L12